MRLANIFLCVMFVMAPLAAEELTCEPGKVTEMVQELLQPIFEKEGIEGRVEFTKLEYNEDKSFNMNAHAELTGVNSSFDIRFDYHSIDEKISKFELIAEGHLINQKNVSLFDIIPPLGTQEEFEAIVNEQLNLIADEIQVDLKVDSWGDGSVDSVYAWTMTFSDPADAVQDMRVKSSISSQTIKIQTFLDIDRTNDATRKSEENYLDNLRQLCSADSVVKEQIEAQAGIIIQGIQFIDSYTAQQIYVPMEEAIQE